MSYTYQKRPASPAHSPVPERQPAQNAQPYVPNSSYPGVLDGGMGADALREAMRNRMASRFHGDYVNAKAEAEADSIGERFSHAGSPEELKAQMGAALGADFSAVRFRTGSEAAAMNEASGSNAFASGKDVYLGKDGFNASTAAHELVHTVQQGAVAAAAPVMSAPAGAVQYQWGAAPNTNGTRKNYLGRRRTQAVNTQPQPQQQPQPQPQQQPQPQPQQQPQPQPQPQQQPQPQPQQQQPVAPRRLAGPEVAAQMREEDRKRKLNADLDRVLAFKRSGIGLNYAGTKVYDVPQELVQQAGSKEAAEAMALGEGQWYKNWMATHGTEEVFNMIQERNLSTMKRVAANYSQEQAKTRRNPTVQIGSYKQDRADQLKLGMSEDVENLLAYDQLIQELAPSTEDTGGKETDELLKWNAMVKNHGKAAAADPEMAKLVNTSKRIISALNPNDNIFMNESTAGVSKEEAEKNFNTREGWRGTAKQNGVEMLLANMRKRGVLGK